MTRYLLIMVLLCLPGQIRAEAVTVRSGEHATFTRLVAFLPQEPAWTVTRDGREVLLRISGEARYEFDTSTVFNRIPKTRIDAIRQAGRNGLTIGLSCDCTVDTFFQAPRMLVIDVQDAPEPEAGASRPRGTEDTDTASAGVTARSPALTAALRDALVARSSYSTSSLTQIAEALARRTTGDVLDLGDPDAIQPSRNTRIGANLRNITLPNISLPGSGPDQETLRLTADCDALAAAPLGRFDGEGAYDKQKAAITARLYTERLDLDSAAAVELAQLHLSRGLGAEAAQLLDMAGGRSGGHAFLADLATLVDAPGSVTRAAVDRFVHCTPSGILWSVLAAARRPMDEEAAWQVARAAQVLPRPLLRAIASRLISNLVDSGQPDPADMISRMLNRSGGPDDPSMADVLLAADADAQDAILDEIARSNGTEAAAASALLVERKVAAGGKVPQRLSDLVGSHAAEQRHGDAAGMLRKAEAFSLISRGQFAQAQAILRSGDLDAAAQAATAAHFYRELTRAAETVTFLKVVLGDLATAADMPAEVRQALAARLYKNQFPSAAAQLIGEAEPLDPALVAQALSARLFGEVGIPDEVLFDQAERVPEAAEARYAALLSAGRFAEAKATAMTLGKADPVDALLQLDPSADTTPEPDAQDPAAPELTMRQANELTESTSALARSVADILNHPALVLDE